MSYKCPYVDELYCEDAKKHPLINKCETCRMNPNRKKVKMATEYGRFYDPTNLDVETNTIAVVRGPRGMSKDIAKLAKEQKLFHKLAKKSQLYKMKDNHCIHIGIVLTKSEWNLIKKIKEKQL